MAARETKKPTTDELVKTWRTIRAALKKDAVIVATTCANCLKVCEKTLVCTKCHYARYCGKDCQKAAWPEHKALCSPDAEHEMLAKFLRKLGVCIVQDAFADILHLMKETLPNVGAIQIEYKDILKMTPSINQQIDHLLWFLIGGGSPTMTFIELNTGDGGKLTSDGVMRLVVTFNGKPVRAYRAGGITVTAELGRAGGGMEGSEMSKSVVQSMSTPS